MPAPAEAAMYALNAEPAAPQVLATTVAPLTSQPQLQPLMPMPMSMGMAPLETASNSAFAPNDVINSSVSIDDSLLHGLSALNMPATGGSSLLLQLQANSGAAPTFPLPPSCTSVSFSRLDL